MANRGQVLSVALAALLSASQTACEQTAKGKKLTASRDPIQIVTDKTSSGSDTALDARAGNIRKGMEELDPSAVSVVRFGEEDRSIWDTPEVAFEMPEPPIIEEFNEKAAEKEINESCRARKPCRDARVEEMRRAHGDDMKQREVRRLEARDGKLDLITEAIVRPPIRGASCTDLYGTRDRIATDAYNRVILITDGQHTCANISFTKSFPKQTKVLVLLTSVKGESVGDDFEKRRTFVKNLFPDENVKVIPIVSATSAKITQALR